MKTYLSVSTTGQGRMWRVIQDGNPLCRDTDRATALAAYQRVTKDTTPETYNGDTGLWTYAIEQ